MTEIVNYKGVEYKVRTIEVRKKVEGQTITSKLKIAPIELIRKPDASIDHYTTTEVIDTVADVISQDEVAELTQELVEVEW